MSSVEERIRKLADTFRCDARVLRLIPLLLLAAASAHCGHLEPDDGSVGLVAGPAGVAREAQDLLVALPIRNTGDASAAEVRVTAAELGSGGVPAQTAFPVLLGDLAPGGESVFTASFPLAGLDSGGRLRVAASGTYSASGTAERFSVEGHVVVPPPAPGSAELRLVTVESRQVSGGGYPPGPRPIELPESVNERGAPVPTVQPLGEVRPAGPPATVEGFGPAAPPGAATAGLARAVDPLVFVRAGEFLTKDGTAVDLSGATSNDVILGSVNTEVAVSIDGGSSFPWILDPRAIFPNTDGSGNLIDGGVCCDQVVIYVPAIDRFLWLMQFWWKTNGPNRYRLAVASPQQILDSAGTNWTYWDLTSGLFGFGSEEMDYPDLAYGDNFLYLSADVSFDLGGGLFVARIPLSQLEAGGAIGIGFTDPAHGVLARGSRLAQNVSSTAYWAGHNGTSMVRVFACAENSTNYSWTDVGIDSWPNGDYSSLAPSGVDWMGFGAGWPGSNIIGATVTSHYQAVGGVIGSTDDLWLAWAASRGGGFPHPHIQVVKIDTYKKSKIAQGQIWSSDVALAYPALAANSAGDVGVALAFGGGGFHSNFAVGIYGDQTYLHAELGDASAPLQGNPPVSRFADYLSIRRHWPNNRLFSAFGEHFALNDPTLKTVCPPCRTNAQFILFGRKSALTPLEPPK